MGEQKKRIPLVDKVSLPVGKNMIFVGDREELLQIVTAKRDHDDNAVIKQCIGLHITTQFKKIIKHSNIL